MALKLIEAVKAYFRRVWRQSRVCDEKTKKCNMLEGIAQVHGGSVVSHREIGGGVTRMKILVKKKDPKPMLATMRSGKNNSTRQLSPLSSTTTLLENLHSMWKQHLKRVDDVKGKFSPWRPDLHSIAEEW